MAYLNWSDSYSVNVQEIDNQHKNLINMINTLHDAMLENKGRETHCSIIGAMVSYANIHFETEEKYMRRFGFTDYPSHKIEHDQFTVKALDLKERSENDGFILTLEILTFLKKWLQDHILGTDMRYAPHFNANGLH